MGLVAERLQMRLGTFALAALLITAASLALTTQLSAQTTKETFEDKIGKLATELAASTPFKTLTPDQQRDAAFFVIGNMLFAVAHEFGHTVMSEMDVPVIGRMEDGADSFAIVTGLTLMTDTSERALIEAGKGWFFMDLAERKSGAMAVFYNSHGMNLQRAYQIVCYMVGANPTKFKALADATKLPESRQVACKDDFAIAKWGWEVVLYPYRVSTDKPGAKSSKPSAKFTVNYDKGLESLAVYEKTFKELGFLERFADMAMERFAWGRPITLSMETCGKVNAWWSEPNAKITVCYELVDEFVKLYMQFMTDPAMEKRMQALSPPELTR